MCCTIVSIMISHFYNFSAAIHAFLEFFRKDPIKSDDLNKSEEPIQRNENPENNPFNEDFKKSEDTIQRNENPENNPLNEDSKKIDDSIQKNVNQVNDALNEDMKKLEHPFPNENQEERNGYSGGNQNQP